MLFNSVDFAIFLPLVFLLYWFVFNRAVKTRNIYITAVSYLFYGMWNWKFLALIIFSSMLDFVLGSKIHQSSEPKKRKSLLLVSLIVNLGFLAYFKYCNFFLESFTDTFSFFGADINIERLSIVLPVGISFYTFQTLSYTIDIYRKKLEPTDNLFSFLGFVSFFPQLVAGPIERAKDLLPQFNDLKKPNYDNFKKGLLLITWGLFTKIVIADRLAIFVDATFHVDADSTGIAYTIGAIFFAFQLYLDFSAYSNIAIGTAKLMGFNLSTNFNKPYLSSSFSNFWNRWHISLSSWFRDYLYFPLGGSLKGKVKTYRNVLIVFIISGFWHGASWNFVIWGALNGLFLILFDPLLQKIAGQNFIIRFFKAIFVSSLWVLSLIFFRAKTFDAATGYYSKIGFDNSDQLFQFGLNEFEFKLSVCLILGIILLEGIIELKKSVIDLFYNSSVFIRWPLYFAIIIATILYGSYGAGINDQTFIYFQF